MIAFYHDNDIDMLNLGHTLPNPAKTCLHKSIDANFYPFTGCDKNLLEILPEDFFGSPLIVFTP